MSDTGGISLVRSINDPVFKRALAMNRGGPVGDLSAPPPTKADPGFSKTGILQITKQYDI